MPFQARAVLRAVAVGGLLVAAGCSTADGTAPRPAGSAPSVAPTSPTDPGTRPTLAAPATTTSPATGDRVAACAQALVATLTPADRVGQLLLVGVPANDPAEGISAAVQYRLGGLFLAGRTSLTPAGLDARVQSVQAAVVAKGVLPLHVAVDQEGGAVRNLRGEGFLQLPSAVEQATWDDATLARANARVGEQLHAAGVSVDLAPVADVVPASLDVRNPPIGALGREYGSTPDAAGRRVPVVVRALQQQSVMATLKHFPGLGRVRANTDFSTDAVDELLTPTDDYLRPFQAGIDAGAAFVMVSSATYPRIDPRTIAAFSPAVVSTLLRGSMHFRGVVMTDDVGAAVAVRDVPVGERAVRFVRAGGDMVLTIRPQDAQPMVMALGETAQRDRAFAGLVEEAAVRIVTSKVRAGLLTCRK